MRPINTLASLLLSGLILLITGMPAIALPEDREQPIHIKSNRAERDEQRGITIYSGDVIVDQGSMRILANKVVIETENNEVNRIIATGKPATMKQRPSHDKKEVHAQGNTIKYDLEKDMMTLLDNASIEQQGSIVNSERIDYFITDERIKAQGSNIANQGKRRVEMILPPKKADPK